MPSAKLSFTVVCCCLCGSLAAHAEVPPAPPIQVSNVTVTEGNSGQTPFTAQVSLPYYPTAAVTVRVTATPGTADESDYVFATTELTFTGSAGPQTVTGYVLGDTNPEGNEYFTLSATTASGSPVYLVGGYGTVTIIDDDQALASQLHVEGATLLEGNQGTTTAEVRVRLEPASSNTVTVAYQTQDITASATFDYQGVSGTLTFAPGDVLKTLSIPILGDTLPEPDESFAVVLSQPTMALLGTSRAEVVIANDDPVVHATIADLTVDEGDDGVKLVPITIIFDQPASGTSKVRIDTIGAGAVADQDFRVFSQILYPTAGILQMTFDLEVLSDTVPECDEGLYVQYSTLYMGDDTVKQAKVILRNDDGPVPGCPDPFVPQSPPAPTPEPQIDSGALVPPPVEPRAADAGTDGVTFDTGPPSATAPEPQATDAGVVGGTPDTDMAHDVASVRTPDSTSDAQLVPDVQTPSSTGDSGSAKPGDERLATHSGCSCSLGQRARSAGSPWLMVIGLLAILGAFDRARRSPRPSDDDQARRRR
jgi:hypothetical protein